MSALHRPRVEAVLGMAFRLVPRKLVQSGLIDCFKNGRCEQANLRPIMGLRERTIVNVKSEVTLLSSGAPPHRPLYLGHPLPQGGEGSVNLNSCPRPLGGEGGERSEPGEGVSNLFKLVYIRPALRSSVPT